MITPDGPIDWESEDTLPSAAIRDCREGDFRSFRLPFDVRDGFTKPHAVNPHIFWPKDAAFVANGYLPTPRLIVTYQFRKEETLYSRRVEMDEIEKDDFNLNISRYISTTVCEEEIDLAATHNQLVEIERKIRVATHRRNSVLDQLGLSQLPIVEKEPKH